jgi:hypothetical protein
MVAVQGCLLDERGHYFKPVLQVSKKILKPGN